MLSSIPLVYRMTALFAAAVVIAWIDWRRHGHQSTKWREYVFLIFVSLLGALFGMANDTLTSHLSPEYFIYGKGIAPGPHFFNGVLALAFQAGLFAAFIGGACYLFANNPKPGRPSLPYSRLYLLIAWPLVGAILGATILGVGSKWLAASQVDPEMSKALGESQAIWFWRVWYIHLGLYSGLLIGVGCGLIIIRRARRVLAENKPS